MSEAGGHEYLKSHQLTGDVLNLELGRDSQAIIEEARTTAVGHAARILAKNGTLRLVLVGLTTGSTIHEHSADGPLSIQVLLGWVDVATSGGVERIYPGRILVLGPNVAHSVTSEADAVILLTIAASVTQRSQ